MKILFFDTETTGFYPPAIVQLWLITWEYEPDWKVINETPEDIIFNPRIPIGEKAMEVHGITEDDVKWKPFFDTYLKRFVEITKEVDYICWHNLNFDLKAIFWEVDRIFPKESEQREKIESWKLEVIEKWIDTMVEWTNYCEIPGRWLAYKWPKLEELHIKLFNKNFENAHDAMADIIATKDCFFEMKKLWLFNKVK